MFTQEYAFVERCCFLRFLFEGKFRKYDISVKRKHTKSNENIIFSVFFTNFRKTKILFFMRCQFITGVGCSFEVVLLFLHTVSLFLLLLLLLLLLLRWLIINASSLLKCCCSSLSSFISYINRIKCSVVANMCSVNINQGRLKLRG